MKIKIGRMEFTFIQLEKGVGIMIFDPDNKDPFGTILDEENNGR